MIWEVETEGGSVELTAFEVLNLLMGKVISKERSDHEALALTFTEYLQNNQSLGTISLTQLSSMAFEIGYFYRVFKEKNEVTTTEVNIETSSDQDEPTPTS